MIFRTHPVTLGAATQIDGVADVTVDPGRVTARQTADGNVDPWFAATLREAGTISFSTTSVATALGYTGTRTQSGAISVFDVPVGSTGLKAASGVKYSAASGCIYPTNISVSDGGYAQVSVTAAVLGPLTMQNFQTASTFVSGATQYFGLGPIFINGTQVKGIQNVSVDFGNQVAAEFGDGNIRAISQALVAHMPTITVQTTSPDEIVNLLSGSICADFDVYLRRASCDGYQTTGAVRLQVADALITPTATGGGQGPRTMGFMVEPVRTASGVDPIVLDVDATLP